MDLFHLVYVSSASVAFPPAELLQLLEISRRNNTPRNITGLLLYRDGNFMQVLEGEEQHVRETHARILRDTRHQGAITLLQERIVERAFPGWAMAFRNLNAPELKALPGYSDFLNEDWFGAPILDDPDRALQLLLTFRGGLR